MSKNTPAEATVNRVIKALSPNEGRSASSVANEVGVSASTARKCLTVLRERGQAYRSNETGDWFPAVDELQPTVENDVPFNDPKLEDKIALAVELTTQDLFDSDHATSETSAVQVLEDLGFSKRLAKQDGALVDLLREHGPLSEAKVFEKLGEFSSWSFRRMTEGKHGRLSFDPLVETEGRGDQRVYKLAGS